MCAHMWSAARVSAFRVLTRVLCVSSQRVQAFPPVFTAHSRCAPVLAQGLMSRRADSRKMSQSAAQRMVWVDLEVISASTTPEAFLNGFTDSHFKSKSRCFNRNDVWPQTDA